MGCAPGPCRGMLALLAPLQKRVPPGLCAPEAAWQTGCPWSQGGEATPVWLGILAAIPTGGFSQKWAGQGGCQCRGDLRAPRADESGNVPGSLQQGLAPASCATGARAAGSGSPAPSPATRDGPSRSPCLADSRLGRCGLHPCAGAASLLVLLEGETERSPACLFYTKKKPFQSFFLHFAAGFQSLLLETPPCPPFFISVLPLGPH